MPTSKLTKTGRYKVDTDTLRKMLPRLEGDRYKLCLLRLEYIALSHTLSNFIKKMDAQAIFPRILPTQASGRWSTLDPPLTNFPRRCVSPDCPSYLHEKTEQCWSLRDCIKPYPNEFWIDFDYDAIEARLYSLILNDQDSLTAFNKKHDPHTPLACELFQMPLPQDKINPHISEIDRTWRNQTAWQGKDDKRRVLAKNFRYGSQYFYVWIDHMGKLRYNPNYILSAHGVEEVAQELTDTDIKSFLVKLAKKYVTLTEPIQRKKAKLMDQIRRKKIARTLFGSRRIFFEMSEDTAKEGFNHIIQGTVVDIMNHVIISICNHYPDATLVHNAHDGAKIAFPDSLNRNTTLATCHDIIERQISFENNSVTLTAQPKVVEG